MEEKTNGQALLEAALKNIEAAADKTLACPSCNSNQIYTAISVSYYYDHATHTFGVRSITNLAEHGWHGCYVCDHKWVSNTLLQTALPPKAPQTDTQKVIDLARSKKDRSNI